MHRFFARFCLTFIAVSFYTLTIAQIKPDTTKPLSALSRPSAGPKPYSEVITSKAITDEGLFNTHKLDEKFYFEIGDTMFGREILVVNRISKAAAGMRSGFFGYAGDEVGRNVIRFEKGPNNKIFVRSISFTEYSKDSTSPMFTAVNKSNVQPITAAFDIKALSKDSTGNVIDVTDFISNDNDVLFFSSQVKSGMRIGGQQNDKSYIVGVRSYPLNIEINTVKTYSRMAGPSIGSGGTSSGGNITVEMNSSMVLLPKVPMQSRHADPRVGYFTVGYTDFDANPQGVEAVRLIKRWRLEPREEDIEKYKKGELVEPKKPIVFI